MYFKLQDEAFHCLLEKYKDEILLLSEERYFEKEFECDCCVDVFEEKCFKGFTTSKHLEEFQNGKYTVRRYLDDSKFKNNFQCGHELEDDDLDDLNGFEPELIQLLKFMQRYAYVAVCIFEVSSGSRLCGLNFIERYDLSDDEEMVNDYMYDETIHNIFFSYENAKEWIGKFDYNKYEIIKVKFKKPKII